MKALMILLASVMVCSCSGVRHVSKETFEAEYGNSKIVHTMHSYEYLGEKNGKVYLKKSSMSLLNSKKWNDKVLAADLDSLSESVKQELIKLNKVYEPTAEQ